MTSDHEHLCIGPDASQLLGFLCSLGLLEVASHSFPDHAVRMGFRWHAVGFRPVLTIEPSVDREALVERLHEWIAARADSPVLNALGDDLPCDPELFHGLGRSLMTDRDDSAALLAGLGVGRPGADRLDDTGFRTMSGAGHQHFLRFARRIAAETTCEQIGQTLFASWTYDDLGPSLRFDSTDDRRYALRADDPARSASNAPIRTVRAANALAFEGLALLPVVPTERGAATTLVERATRSPLVRWGLWTRPVTRDVAAAFLASDSLFDAPGIAAVYEARRLTVGKFRSFTPSRRTH